MQTLSETARRVLAATSTAWTSCETAADIAARLGDMTPAQVSAHLGRLRALGLVERDAQDSTWCRYDSAALADLEGDSLGQKWATRDARRALEEAEAARPCKAQAERVENFGPEGLTARADLPAHLADGLARPTPGGLGGLAQMEASAGRFYRAAALAREAVRHTCGHTRRARLEEKARFWEAQAQEAEADASDQEAQEKLADLGRLGGAFLGLVGLAVPSALNGFPVVAAWPRFLAGTDSGLRVVADRGRGSYRRFVVATWSPNCGASWTWGHYCESAQEALEVLADAGILAQADLVRERRDLGAVGFAETWGNLAPMAAKASQAALVAAHAAPRA
jgi:DNA-binding transcriptional ArsR family regulator